MLPVLQRAEFQPRPVFFKIRRGSCVVRQVIDLNAGEMAEWLKAAVC